MHFLKRHRKLAKIAFKAPYAKDTMEGQRLVVFARTNLGYSDNTYTEDIFRSLRTAWERAKL